MTLRSVLLLTLASFAAAGNILSLSISVTIPALTLPGFKTSTIKTSTPKTSVLQTSTLNPGPLGTWTYYSTITNTIGPTTTFTIDPQTSYIYVPNPSDKTVTISTGLTVYAATETTTISQPGAAAFAFVSPTTTVRTTSVPTPAGFTPILSQFAYTASLKVTTTTKTTSLTATTYVDSPVTRTSTFTLPPVTSTKTSFTASTTVPATTTVTTSTLTISTYTSTLMSVPTHHAICDEDSGNYVNYYPFGATIQPFYYGPFKPSGDGSVHALDKVYFNSTYLAGTKVDCCNIAMSQGPAAWGFWEPQDIYGNACYIFNVRDETACNPREVKYSLVRTQAEDPFQGRYFAFNGRCGRVTPDHHEQGYYENGGKYTPENSP